VRRTAAFTKLPVLITESGIATEHDAERIVYIDRALRGVHACITEGIDVRGYFVWSLLDNFEWNMGYEPKLGLYSVDRTTFERQPKPSARWYERVARGNLLAPVGH
jgi:beta-glucosidase